MKRLCCTQALCVFALALLSGACATPPSQPEVPGIAVLACAAPPQGRRHEFSISREEVTLDTFTSDVVDANGDEIGDVDLHDVEQTLTCLRYRYGSSSVGLYFGLVGEELFEDVFDLAGVEVGCDGFPQLGLDADFTPGLDYSAGFSIRAGDGDAPVLDTNGQQIGTAHRDVVDLDLSARLGGGFGFRGLQVSAGIVASALTASFEDDSADTRFDGDAFNAGPYLRTWFRSDSSPFTGGIQLMGGDHRGALASLGLRF